MDLFLSEHGYLSLFFLSFLASTVVPLGSEWLLVILLLEGHSPVATVAVATVGNTLGACTTYAVGLYGGPLVVSRALRIDEAGMQRAQRLYGRYGSWSLLFSWVPIIGDPLCVVSGFFKTRFAWFLTLVLVGKLARYVVISLVTMATAGEV
jgi:membrane protein YqaA with SNARE-associated domain